MGGAGGVCWPQRAVRPVEGPRRRAATDAPHRAGVSAILPAVSGGFPPTGRRVMRDLLGRDAPHSLQRASLMQPWGYPRLGSCVVDERTEMDHIGRLCPERPQWNIRARSAMGWGYLKSQSLLPIRVHPVIRGQLPSPCR